MTEIEKRINLVTAAIVAIAWFFTPPVSADVTFIGAVQIPGNATDLSGLADALEDGTPHNRLGAFGSAIAYAGFENRYILLPDRGPNTGDWNIAVDNTTSYQVRFHLIDVIITQNPSGEFSLEHQLIATTLLQDESRRPFVGFSSQCNMTISASDEVSTIAARRDPEGVRVGRDGHVFVSDEYGPFIDEFDALGRRLRSIEMPEKFLIANPGPTRLSEQPPRNLRGRLPNRGMEGLAISPEGRRLFGIMQSPLIQDNDGQAKLSTPFVRLLEIDLKHQTTREYLYLLDNPNLGISEIVAINDHEFLVIERDNLAGGNACFKKIMRIDVCGASDISRIEQLSKPGALNCVTAVRKTPFLDLIAGYGFRRDAMGIFNRSAIINVQTLQATLTKSSPLDLLPEKIEGLAFGPDLPDGRHLLLITTDNDFIADRPSFIFAFAVDRAELPDYRAQQFDSGIDHQVFVRAAQGSRKDTVREPSPPRSNSIQPFETLLNSFGGSPK